MSPLDPNCKEFGMNQCPRASHLVTVFHLLVIVAIYPSIGRSQDQNEQVEQNSELNLQQQQSMQEILQIRERLGGGLTQQLQGVFDDDAQDFGKSLKSVIQEPPQLELRQPPPEQRWLDHPPSGKSGLFPSRPISCWEAGSPSRMSGPQVQLAKGDVVDIVEKTGKNVGKTILQSVEIHTVQRTPTCSRVQFWVDTQQNKLLDECPESTKLQVKKSSVARLPSSSLPGEQPVGQADHRSVHPSRFSPVRVQQLRQAARDLERIASDLEDLEMYDDADALRLKVQQLRSTARRKNGTTDIMQR